MEDQHNDTTSRQGGDGTRNWYVIYTNSGYENAVVKNLKQRIESMGMEKFIYDVLVPTEKQILVKRGKKVEEDVKIYPGYVMVDMVVNDESWWVVRNTPRVSGFLGTGVHPVPVSDKEMLSVVEKMKGDDAEKHTVNIEVGDYVKITDGPFKDTEGKITGVDEITGQIKVTISMFGRDTEVELDFSQVKSI